MNLDCLICYETTNNDTEQYFCDTCSKNTCLKCCEKILDPRCPFCRQYPSSFYELSYEVKVTSCIISGYFVGILLINILI
jgi:hypothetical protein